ncbi:MAG: hypothetical protein U5N86_07425 [Planctomycetota bacterium]|nr:hypothetical protein [Planctomycetota bacterium]
MVCYDLLSGELLNSVQGNVFSYFGDSSPGRFVPLARRQHSFIAVVDLLADKHTFKRMGQPRMAVGDWVVYEDAMRFNGDRETVQLLLMPELQEKLVLKGLANGARRAGLADGAVLLSCTYPFGSNRIYSVLSSYSTDGGR